MKPTRDSSAASRRGGETLPPSSKKSTVKLPHEHDEHAAPEREIGDEVRPAMRQAHEDVAGGLVDTERRGTPSDVPAPETLKRERSRRGG